MAGISNCLSSAVAARGSRAARRDPPGEDDDDDDEDDIYIMMRCLSVTKNHHFLDLRQDEV